MRMQPSVDQGRFTLMKYMKKNLNYLESDTMMEERASEQHEDHDMTEP